jgi:hypothetical protein
MWYPYTKRRTPFLEVRLEPYYEPKEFKQFLRGMHHQPPILENIWKQFKQSIFENWLPGKIHLIGASSGYDSRLIAKALQELRREHGSDWFGETYFVECAGEAEGFTEIMRTLGFQHNMIIWIPDFTFEYFENLHKRFNGLCAYPMNIWYDFYQQWDEEEIQYISGYGGNVADIINPRSPYQEAVVKRMNVQQRLRFYFEKNYYYQISAFRQPKYSFHPFWSWRYIQAVSGVTHPDARTSVLLSKVFVPECQHIKRDRILYEVTDRGHRTVSQSVIDKLYDWYRNTNYGRIYDCTPSCTIEYNKWWLQLCIANFTEANNIKIL